jgi:hypothetical protein
MGGTVRALLAASASLLASTIASGQASLPVDRGELVHTMQASNFLGGVVVQLIDTTPAGLATAVPGVNATPPIFWNQGAGVHEWTLANLGQLYGVEIDNAANPNIYVTAASCSMIYRSALPFECTFGPGGGGGVYRLDGTTGNICLLASLPNAGRVGLGNVTFSSLSQSIYVSNFEDGLIYRISTATCPVPQGVPIPTYDHGRDGRPAEGLTAITDDGLAQATQLGRRIWGVAVNETENRLYYGVWWDDASTPNASQNNEVWSVGLDAAGNPIAATANLEITLPALGNGGSSPAAGLNFTPLGTLLVGERTVVFAHQSLLREYTGATNAWVAQPANKYRVGVGDTSCTGAGEMDCSGRVWSVGDGIQLNAPQNLYGLIRMPVGGNTADAPSDANSIVIDSDQNMGVQDKTQLGTIAFRPDVCAQPCGRINPIKLEPQIDATGQATGCWTYTFTITNTSGQPVQFMLIPDQNVTPNVIPFVPPLANNATSANITVTICNQLPGPFSFPIVLMDTRNQECCRLEGEIEIPECFNTPVRPRAVCSTAGCNLSITIQPLDFPVGHVFVWPVSPATLGINPTYFPIAIPQFGQQKLNIPFTGVAAGQQLCVRVFIHTPDLRECCEQEICVTVGEGCPDCALPARCDSIDFNNDGLFPDDNDLVDFLAVLAGGSCSNDPFCNDIDFNNNGLFPEDNDLLSLLSILAGGPCID